jgi:dihydroflavonol-4-reductase
MNILVTGANGFIGSRLVAELQKKRKNKIKALVHRSSDRIKDYDVDILKGDIANNKLMKEVVSDSDVVFHLAAKASQWSSNPSEFYETNVLGSVNIFQACLESEVDKLVYTSSSASLGPSQKKPIDLSTFSSRSIKFNTEYERTKYLTDIEADKFIKKGLNIIRVYPTITIGVGCVNDFGKGILIPFNGIPVIIGDGENQLNLVAIKDVVRGHILAAERGEFGGKYLLGGPNISVNEMYKIARELFSLPRPIHIPRTAALILAGGFELISKFTKKPPLLTRTGVDVLIQNWIYTSTDKLGYKPTTKKQIRELIPQMVEWWREKGYISH